jgi:hypothetical protein
VDHQRLAVRHLVQALRQLAEGNVRHAGQVARRILRPVADIERHDLAA